MLGDSDPVPMVYEEDLWPIADAPRGKRKRRVGNTVIYESESVKENTSTEHSKQTSTSDDCGQSFHPTSVTHSTSIKRKASIQVSPGESSKKRKSSGTVVAELQVEDAITSSTHPHITQTQPPVIRENNTYSRLPARRPLKSHSDPTSMPQRNRRASRSIPGRRHSLSTMLARLGLTQRAEWAEQGGRFPALLGSEPVTASDTAMDETPCFTQEPEQLGGRRALLIAIQYEGQYWRGPKTPNRAMYLGGSYADAQDIRNLLMEQGYDPQDIQLMTDEPGTAQNHLPTHANIKRALRGLVAGAKRNDRFFLFFAGHGTQVADKNGDEDDGKDEGIIPCDWATRFKHQDNGIIIDDVLKEICVDPLPRGSQLIVSKYSHANEQSSPKTCTGRF
ncbi:Ca(2+)-dependent cysteine protease [Ceratobasidium sp. 394]|nr:Ca(2+)-dependent cysteine protease [Ceratobasidium sp. 394]